LCWALLRWLSLSLTHSLTTFVLSLSHTSPNTNIHTGCWNPDQSDPKLGVHGCRTLYEAFRHGAALNPLGACMGFRATSSSGVATPYIYSSYTECLSRINALAAGLESLNLVRPNADGLACLGLYTKNCMEFCLAEHAAYTIGGVAVPFYDTLGPETVSFILSQTGLATVLCTRAQLPALCVAKRSGTCPQFTAVILVDGVIPAALAQTRAAGLDVYSYGKVEAVGARRIAMEGRHKHSPPNPQDVAFFCYTSGTTGDPKGALISHENVMAAIGGLTGMVPDSEIQMNDRHLSYLPLAHIFEHVVITQIFLKGASAAFFRGDPLLLIEDLQACRPTMIPVAPRVLNKIYDKIQSGVATVGGLKQKLFVAAVAAKTEGLKHGYLTHALYDALLFNKIKKALGLDQVRFMVSGSAPLAENVMTFFRILLGAAVVEGYGQTEGAAAATIGHSDDFNTTGHVGGPVASVEVVLVDVPEMGYLHTDQDHRGQPCVGRGEICIRGPSVFKGYYKDEVKTKEAIDEEGWLHSGDIGLWRPDGTLQIVDRKKNIFKLSQGEYVAPEKIENILTRSALIGQCFVYGDSLQSALVAILVPDEEPVRLWARQQPDASLAGAPFAQLCASQALKDEMMEDIRRLSKESKLAGFETVKAVHLEAAPFSVESELLTPTFKLKRQKAKECYEEVIRRLYAEMPPPRSKL
jgi:long-chain acyl-CoA synthetase